MSWAKRCTLQSRAGEDLSYLEQVLDALGVALVKVDDFPCQLVDNFIVVHILTNFN